MGPVAPANVRGSEKMPAPTIPPTTIAVSAVRDIFCSVKVVSLCFSVLPGVPAQRDRGAESYVMQSRGIV
jgi:hypothetical protein